MSKTRLFQNVAKNTLVVFAIWVLLIVVSWVLVAALWALVF